jgi:hypothetical protein
MSSSKSALLLVASPRGFKSTSDSLGSYLLKKLHRGGFEIQKLHVQTVMRTPDGQQKMLEQVKGCDLLILAFPLYIDCLPAQLIAALELINQQRKTTSNPKPQRFLTIINNGFPEASQNATAVAICRQFASEADMNWAGGLSLGGGGAINGAKIEDTGFRGRNAKKALEATAADLLLGKTVSTEAAALMAKQAIPRWLFLWFANREWKHHAKECGTQDKLYNKV